MNNIVVVMLGAWAIDAGIRYFQLGFYLSKNQMAWLVVWATFIQACVPRLMNEILFANLTLLYIDALKAISYGMAVWLLFSFLHNRLSKTMLAVLIACITFLYEGSIAFLVSSTWWADMKKHTLPAVLNGALTWFAISFVAFFVQKSGQPKSYK